MVNEIWKEIEGWPYEISSWGRIRRYLEPTKNGGGYLVVTLKRGNDQMQFTLHRLLAGAFMPNTDLTRYQVAHRDGNPANNSLDNLYWATPKENSADTLRLGYQARGEKSGNAILTETAVRVIRSSPLTNSELAREYRVDPCTISAIRHRRTWKHLP